MKNLILSSLLLCGVTAITASAVGITGEISLDGSYTVNVANFNAGFATKFTSFSGVAVSAAPTGAYAGTAGSAVTHSGFKFDPFVGPIIPLWTFTSGGLTYSFDLVSMGIDFRNKKSIVMSGSGLAHITGFDDTVGNWLLSANTAGTTFSFSSTNASEEAVPEAGATLPLLGLAVMGLGLFRKKFAAC